MQQDRNGRNDSDAVSGQIRRTDGETVRKVVRKVGGQVQIAGDFDVLLFGFLLGGLALGFGRFGDFFFALFVAATGGRFCLFAVLLRGGWRWGGLLNSRRPVTMPVSMSSGVLLDQPHQLLHRQKGNNSRQHPQSNAHIVTMSFLSFLPMRMTVTVTMRMPVPMIVALAVMTVRLNGVRNQMQEGIAQQSTGGKRQQGLQPGLHLLRVVQRDGKQDEERSGTDKER